MRLPSREVGGASKENGSDRWHFVSMTWSVRLAHSEDLFELSGLFNDYRCFYGQPADMAVAEAFLLQRFEAMDAIILVAAADRLLGFCQLFPSLSSVRAAPVMILNDLYVAAAARGQGVGGALLNSAIAAARSRGIPQLTLETGVENQAAQRLYEANGWRRAQPLLSYSIDLNDLPAATIPKHQ